MAESDSSVKVLITSPVAGLVLAIAISYYLRRSLPLPIEALPGLSSPLDAGMVGPLHYLIKIFCENPHKGFAGSGPVSLGRPRRVRPNQFHDKLAHYRFAP